MDFLKKSLQKQKDFLKKSLQKEKTKAKTNKNL